MHISVRMNIHILMGFCHAHLFTNDYQYCSCMVSSQAHFCTLFLYGFLSCTFLYEWLSIFLWFFVMHIFVRMTIHFLVYGFLSCTFLYEWLSISFEWFFVMHISVRMTAISFWMGFCYAHFCTNDYHLFLNGFSSCTFLYEWLPFLFEWVFLMHISVRMTIIYFWMVFRHTHFCMNDYHFFVYWFLSCTFLCKWLSIFIWVLCHGHICKNDYLFPISFQNLYTL